MLNFIYSILSVSFFLLAHEGHHDTPGTVAPPNGGVIRSLETIHLEILPQGKIVKIFVYDLKLKPVETKNYPISATATRPRKKSEALSLIAKKNHWEYEYNSKDAHRYMLELSIEQGGHSDKVKWNIEPKRHGLNKEH